MELVHWILLASGIALFIWAVVRWKSCAPLDPEYGPRREMTLLFALLIAGVVGDALRAKFPDGSPGFLLSSVLLIPVALGALVILFRMVSVYQRSHQSGSKTRTAGDRRQGRRE